MKTKKKELKYYEEVYVAADGTEFNQESCCIKYEKTAQCVIMSRYEKLVVSKTTGDELFELAIDSENVDIVFMKDKSDVDTVMSAIVFAHPHYTEDECSADRQEILDKLSRAMESSDCILVGRGADNDTCRLIGSINHIISRFQKIAKMRKEESDE